MVKIIINIGNEAVYEQYKDATDYKIIEKCIFLYDNSSIKVGTINLNNLISIYINNK